MEFSCAATLLRVTRGAFYATHLDPTHSNKAMPLLRSTSFALLAAALTYGAGTVRTFGQASPACGCPTAAPTGTASPGGNNSNDPAFIMPNAAANLARQRVSQALLAGPAPKAPAELVAAEQARYQAFLEATKAHPAQSYGYALGVWKENASTDLQRLVLFRALEATRFSEESASLQFMLKALEDVPAQRQECLRLGRGNSLEKAIAARRLVLLEGNPHLQAAMEAGK